MPKTVAMYDKALEHIGPRLDALGLDLRVITFSKDGRFGIDGRRVPPSEVDVDFLWLSQRVNGDGFQAGAFQLALDCKSVGVLQTYNAGLDHPFYRQLSDKGTRLCNSSAQGVAIAEYVMAQVLAVVQPIEQQRAQQAARTWKITPFRELSNGNASAIGETLARLA